MGRTNSLLDVEEFTYERGRRERVSQELEPVPRPRESGPGIRSPLPCRVREHALESPGRS